MEVNPKREQPGDDLTHQKDWQRAVVVAAGTRTGTGQQGSRHSARSGGQVPLICVSKWCVLCALSCVQRAVPGCHWSLGRLLALRALAT